MVGGGGGGADDDDNDNDHFWPIRWTDKLTAD